FSGYINIASAGVLNIGTTSDDGVRIKIGGVDIVNNDGSHGDVTKDQDVNFASSGLYPIEITYFNGDWTSDGNNHSGSTDPGLHGGANFHLRMGSADVTSAGTAMLHPVAPLPLTSIGLNFGADEVTSNSGKPTALAPTDVAGAVPQANWNNLNGASGTASSGIAANQGGTAVATTISVE